MKRNERERRRDEIKVAIVSLAICDANLWDNSIEWDPGKEQRRLFLTLGRIHHRHHNNRHSLSRRDFYCFKLGTLFYIIVNYLDHRRVDNSDDDDDVVFPSISFYQSHDLDKVSWVIFFFYIIALLIFLPYPGPNPGPR